jgi:hypothetical protein
MSSFQRSVNVVLIFVLAFTSAPLDAFGKHSAPFIYSTA